MKLSTLFIINTIVAAIFGIAFVILPGPVLSLYDVTVDPTSMYLGQIFGAALISFAILTYLARNAPASPLRDAIVLALFVGDAVGFIASLLAQLAGVANGLGWITVVIYLLLALGFGYFYLVQGRRSVASAAKA
jgi:hypothetical protein